MDLVGGIQIPVPVGDAGGAAHTAGTALHNALDGLHILTQGPVKCLLAGYAHVACEVSGLHPGSPGGAVRCICASHRDAVLIIMLRQLPPLD